LEKYLNTDSTDKTDLPGTVRKSIYLLVNKSRNTSGGLGNLHRNRIVFAGTTYFSNFATLKIGPVAQLDRAAAF
jgi:hypothetical protein